MSDLVVDPFAGPGGWSWAARQLGIDDVGIELDAAACATRAAAGLKTIRADVAGFPLDRLTRKVWGAPLLAEHVLSMATGISRMEAAA